MSIEDEAASWFGRIRSGDAEDVRAEFDAWFAVPEHARAYERLVRAWDKTMFMAHTRTGQERSLEAFSKKARSARALGIAAAVAGLALLGTATLLGIRSSGPDRDAIAASEAAVRLDERPRAVRLADGSTVLLDRGSTLQISFTSRDRRLRLVSGRARFTVAHEKARPFVVEAGTGSVIAHGTVFDVGFAGKGLEVALLRGSIEVQEKGRETGPVVRYLSAGQKVMAAGGDIGTVARLGQGDIQWARDMIVFDAAPLPEAIAQFNRTSTARIALAGDGTGGLRLTGAFRRSEPEAFARQLAGTFDLVLTANGDGSFGLAAKKNGSGRK
ncbi:FecR family protein [Novosphingobium sp. PhB55]|uniref:FecR family protein n=1 Tax=Novosphingobium sp. PhB55 TaxID=2485106 RepID=UPI001065AC35|nr:FecR domain-containing protein [Novosphingobium sp. PhB55]TDW61554.1 FecR family protein [Novosphingobium sp. PhB55]